MLQVPAIMGSLVIQDGYHFQPKKIHFYLTSHFSKLINMAGRDCPKMSPCLTIGCSCTIVIIHDKFLHPLSLSWSLLSTPHKTWLF
jgi:hypothetical protein